MNLSIIIQTLFLIWFLLDVTIKPRPERANNQLIIWYGKKDRRKYIKIF